MTNCTLNIIDAIVIYIPFNISSKSRPEVLLDNQFSRFFDFQITSQLFIVVATDYLETNNLKYL